MGIRGKIGIPAIIELLGSSVGEWHEWQKCWSSHVVVIANQTTDPRRPMIKPTTKSTKNTTNRILAMLAAVPATTPKPNTPAIKAIIKKVNAQLNMVISNSRRVVPHSCERHFYHELKLPKSYYCANQ